MCAEGSIEGMCVYVCLSIVFGVKCFPTTTSRHLNAWERSSRSSSDSWKGETVKEGAQARITTKDYFACVQWAIQLIQNWLSLKRQRNYISPSRQNRILI